MGPYSPHPVTSNHRICVSQNRGRAIASTIFFGLLTVSAIGGLASGQQAAAKLLVLAIVGPLFGLYLSKATRRSPILILDDEKLVDLRRRSTVRWNAVERASISEWRGMFGSYHQLIVRERVDQPRPSYERADTASKADGLNQVRIDSIDGMSLSWDEIAALVEEHLPNGIALRREAGYAKKKPR
jgi:hypothetical protein